MNIWLISPFHTSTKPENLEKICPVLSQIMWLESWSLKNKLSKTDAKHLARHAGMSAAMCLIAANNSRDSRISQLILLIGFHCMLVKKTTILDMLTKPQQTWLMLIMCITDSWVLSFIDLAWHMQSFLYDWRLVWSWSGVNIDGFVCFITLFNWKDAFSL